MEAMFTLTCRGSDAWFSCWCLGPAGGRPLAAGGAVICGPAGEYLRRLGMVTTTRGMTSWYLDPRTAGRPEPRFRGDTGPARIFVARFAAAGRSSFAPWLDARLEPAAGGGPR
jgi:hypothetical protein